MSGGIHWRAWGEAPAEAVLLHCSLAQSGALSGLARALDRPAKGLDFPGHGRSATHDPLEDYGDQSFAAVLEGLPEHPVDVIGHSFGATIALRLVLERPRAVRRLVLIEPALVAAARGTPVHAAYMDSAATVFDEFDAGRREAAARAFNRLWGGMPWDRLPEPQRDELARLIHIIPAQHSAVVTDAPGVLAPGRLETVACPVLLVQGAASPPIVGAIMDALAARLPGAARVRIEEAGHMAPLSHPGEVAAAVGPFLDATARTQAFAAS